MENDHIPSLRKGANENACCTRCGARSNRLTARAKKAQPPTVAQNSPNDHQCVARPAQISAGQTKNGYCALRFVLKDQQNQGRDKDAECGHFKVRQRAMRSGGKHEFVETRHHDERHCCQRDHLNWPDPARATGNRNERQHDIALLLDAQRPKMAKRHLLRRQRRPKIIVGERSRSNRLREVHRFVQQQVSDDDHGNEKISNRENARNSASIEGRNCNLVDEQDTSHQQPRQNKE